MQETGFHRQALRPYSNIENLVLWDKILYFGV